MIKNLNIGAVICEFNPFHKGHELILTKMKTEGAVVCLMSGNFVQRGDLAITDKWTRAKMALNLGADLVLELPLAIASSGARCFSLGSIEILDSLKIIDKLYFGSESGDTNSLSKIVDCTYNPQYDLLIKEELKKGISFASARESAVSKILKENYNNELSGSNNNLGIEYMKAIKDLNSSIVPFAIKREGASHDSISSESIVSAMQIRSMILSGDLNFYDKLPNKSADILKQSIANGHSPAFISKLETAILFKLRSMSKKDFSLLPDVSEGLDNKLYKSARIATSLSEMIDLCKSKRYTHARLRRLILHAFLGVKHYHQKPRYIRVLATNETGRDILKNSEKSLPIIGKYSDVKSLSPEALELFNLECFADDVYTLALPKAGKCESNKTTKIISATDSF